MAREDLHFRLRIPEDLKNKVEEAAAENRRSMTAEIIHRLERTFETDSYIPSVNAHPDDDTQADEGTPSPNLEKSVENLTVVIRKLTEQLEAKFNITESSDY